MQNTTMTSSSGVDYRPERHWEFSYVKPNTRTKERVTVMVNILESSASLNLKVLFRLGRRLSEIEGEESDQWTLTSSSRLPVDGSHLSISL